MVVRNEEANLAPCLGSALPHVDEVIIADTGSTDGTRDLIRSIAHAEPLALTLDPANCHSLTPARNALYERVATEWILYLDADERISAGSGEMLRNASAAAATGVDGFFGRWETFLPGQPGFEDYKLFLFRRHLRKRGLAHANVQLDIRQRGGHAAWMDGFCIEHYPSASLMPAKRDLYWRRLQRSMQLEPGWLRHNWFAGYMCAQDARFVEAQQLFAPLIDSRSHLFPVEGLNARMVSVDMLARQGRTLAARQMVMEAIDFASMVAKDFEVQINRRILPWLTAAARQLDDGGAPHAYRFSA